MADKSISELTVATSISNSDLFVVQQNSEAKAVTGATFLAMVEAHGGIASVQLNADYTLTITFADGTTWTSTSIRGATGAKGDTGDDAEILLTEYQESTSGTVTPSGTWTTTIPSVTDGNFLWMRFTWNNGSYSYMVTKFGENGEMALADYDASEAVKNAGGIVAYITDNAVKYTASQSLTDSQKATARNNIGLPITSLIVDDGVLYLTGTMYVSNNILYLI